ncbi:hypothetical protein V1478_003908 [Vespula squamosa]|uniref:Uncharacterized protein n=1 Tax=Vespula squamosa TaxID=30214 RepID=A0ABD2BN63_VESSQ
MRYDRDARSEMVYLLTYRIIKYSEVHDEASLPPGWAGEEDNGESWNRIRKIKLSSWKQNGVREGKVIKHRWLDNICQCAEIILIPCGLPNWRHVYSTTSPRKMPRSLHAFRNHRELI